MLPEIVICCRHSLTTKKQFKVQTYREVEVGARMMNDAFVFYLQAFPSLLLAIVAVLMFGVIRIWHNGSNIMFPMCGFRCSFEAITPLAGKMLGNLITSLRF